MTNTLEDKLIDYKTKWMSIKDYPPQDFLPVEVIFIIQYKSKYMLAHIFEYENDMIIVSNHNKVNDRIINEGFWIPIIPFGYELEI